MNESDGSLMVKDGSGERGSPFFALSFALSGVTFALFVGKDERGSPFKG